MDTPSIRIAQKKDATSLADLVRQLGYSADPAETASRLGDTQALDHHAVFVAEIDEKVLGWVHVYLCPLLISPPQAQLGGLVVAEGYRGKTIGRQLMDHAEAWAREHGSLLLTVYTNVVRDDALRFYREIGYQQSKTEHVLVKPLVR